MHGPEKVRFNRAYTEAGSLRDFERIHLFHESQQENMAASGFSPRLSFARSSVNSCRLFTLFKVLVNLHRTRMQRRGEPVFDHLVRI